MFLCQSRKNPKLSGKYAEERGKQTDKENNYFKTQSSFASYIERFLFTKINTVISDHDMFN